MKVRHKRKTPIDTDHVGVPTLMWPADWPVARSIAWSIRCELKPWRQACLIIWGSPVQLITIFLHSALQEGSDCKWLFCLVFRFDSTEWRVETKRHGLVLTSVRCEVSLRYFDQRTALRQFTVCSSVSVHFGITRPNACRSILQSTYPSNAWRDTLTRCMLGRAGY